MKERLSVRVLWLWDQLFMSEMHPCLGDDTPWCAFSWLLLPKNLLTFQWFQHKSGCMWESITIFRGSELCLGCINDQWWSLLWARDISRLGAGIPGPWEWGSSWWGCLLFPRTNQWHLWSCSALTWTNYSRDGIFFHPREGSCRTRNARILSPKKMSIGQNKILFFLAHQKGDVQKNTQTAAIISATGVQLCLSFYSRRDPPSLAKPEKTVIGECLLIQSFGSPSALVTCKSSHFQTVAALENPISHQTGLVTFYKRTVECSSRGEPIRKRFGWNTARLHVFAHKVKHFSRTRASDHKKGPRPQGATSINLQGGLTWLTCLSNMQQSWHRQEIACLCHSSRCITWEAWGLFFLLLRATFFEISLHQHFSTKGHFANLHLLRHQTNYSHCDQCDVMSREICPPRTNNNSFTCDHMPTHVLSLKSQGFKAKHGSLQRWRSAWTLFYCDKNGSTCDCYRKWAKGCNKFVCRFRNVLSLQYLHEKILTEFQKISGTQHDRKVLTRIQNFLVRKMFTKMEPFQFSFCCTPWCSHEMMPIVYWGQNLCFLGRGGVVYSFFVTSLTQWRLLSGENNFGRFWLVPGSNRKQQYVQIDNPRGLNHQPTTTKFLGECQFKLLVVFRVCILDVKVSATA